MTPAPPPPPGVCCPKCGGRRFAVVYTRFRRAETVRVKRCRRCGHRIRTSERVVSTAA